MPDLSPSNRRRSRRAETRRTVTYQLRAGVADSVRAAVDAGVAPDANTFVEDAIVERLKELRRERLYAAYAEAANDPEYTAEMAEITAEFEPAIGDGLDDE
jgi:hypothetical protein